ncbi:hypothetical protein FHS43_002029 [Streptosporangium becharense]|uniref:Uncharacterized protein n=1 Tax=Streptosporangium becharense TaxID=1816182 RepID=A0A7W9IC00_9ACTN|nr:hypothetical protein [Streptosporangium becharense]MBB2910766.1 hypothetical protein [Streptosporangium becharense]MBB5817461.1 hypothetical protein [Streptosporangium becharense]
MLRPFPATVELLAERTEWPPPYDPDRPATDEVPSAAVRFDDMYVGAGLRLDTAARACDTRVRVTNEDRHDGVGDERVFARPSELVRDTGGGITGE